MTEEDLPKMPVMHSMKIQVEAGKTYRWCSCGLSANQPFCDDSHIGTGFQPVLYQASESKIVGFCGCKYTKQPPICDGAHKQFRE